jgi:glucosamine 6-phosphate synthetase-like amidotransferase/phosphosugar isomerase protein
MAEGECIKIYTDIKIIKRSIRASKLTNLKEYNNLFSNNSIIALMGHSRMETNGSLSDSNNNQPVVKNNIVTIHNGIIVNDGELWKANRNLKRFYEVDTEIINSLFHKYYLKAKVSRNRQKKFFLKLKEPHQ